MNLKNAKIRIGLKGEKMRTRASLARGVKQGDRETADVVVSMKK